MLIRGGIKSENLNSGLNFNSHSLLSLYSDPPQDEIDLDEFETFALDRLQLLRGFEKLRSQDSNHDGHFDDKPLRRKMAELESKHIPLKSKNDIKKDTISHFILRMV